MKLKSAPLLPLISLFGLLLATSVHGQVKVGAYYFDGWTGQTFHASKKLKTQFSERQPVWGWRTSTSPTIEKQIDAAADAGIGFFSFCWYYNAATLGKDVGNDPKNNALHLYLASKNKRKLDFALLVANHKGYKIKPSDWEALCVYWIKLFKDPSYVTVNKKPLITFFEMQSLVSAFGHSSKVAAAFTRFKEMAVKEGLEGVTIAACSGPEKEALALAVRCGVDLFTGYNYHDYGLKSGKTEVVPIDSMRSVESRIWSDIISQTKKPLIPVITLNWDRRPWDAASKVVSPRFSGFSAESIRKALQSGKNWVRENESRTTSEKIILMYAWNEYGEGAWLTPSPKMKNTLLEGVREGVK